MASVQIAQADAVVGPLAAALSSKDVGNQMFRSSDFEGAAAKFCLCVAECESALQTCDKADRSAWKELRATACSNAAAACLRLGAPVKAGNFCEVALKVDRSHAKVLARLAEARKAEEKWVRDVLDPYTTEDVRAKRFFTEGKYHEGLTAARQAAAVARSGRDHVLEAKALLMIADFASNQTAGETVQDLIEAALAVLNVCRPLAGKPDYLLTNTRTGAMPRLEIDFAEAKAWLVLAMADVDGRTDPVGCRQKWQEHALPLFTNVETALSPESERYTDVVAGSYGNACEVLARACLQRCEYVAANAGGGELLGLVRRFLSRCSPEAQAHLRLALMYVAEYLSVGPRPQCFDTCSRMLRFAIVEAKQLGGLKAEWEAVYTLLRASRFGSEMARVQPPSARPLREGPEGVLIMQEFFEVLRRMGRNVADCAICLSPMDPADQSQPIQALGCTHAFHQACVQAHVWRRANDRGGSVCPACRTPMELMSESESRSYVHPKV